MIRCLSLFIPINYLTILSLVAMACGLYFFFRGFHLLARKRLLLATPTSKIQSAVLGPVEVTGTAVGPYTLSAPITGKPCFLYRTVAWQLRNTKKQEWEKVADETLHLLFFIEDSTAQLLIEPLGADLDLHHDFQEEYEASFFSLNMEGVPPRLSVFLSRHGIFSGRRLRIEESLIKPGDTLFAAGTLTENPGVQVRPFSPHSESPRDSASDTSSEPIPAPQIIRLKGGPTHSTVQEMTQQERIAAALTLAGIAKPEAWSAAGVPYQRAAIDENSSPAPASAHSETSLREASGFDLTPPFVLMKGANDPALVISFRSQKEIAIALAWKSSAMIWGGVAITLLGLYMLLARVTTL
ncbi:MAG: GIDE domain-containing protein [Terriglobales bacterium]